MAGHQGPLPHLWRKAVPTWVKLKAVWGTLDLLVQGPARCRLESLGGNLSFVVSRP